MSAGAAAIGGSVVGGLTSILSGYVLQRQQARAERLGRELDRKEDLYSRFNEMSAELLMDSLDHSLDEPAKLVGLIMLAGRIRLTSSKSVLDTAEHVIAMLLESYRQPAMDRRCVLDKPHDFIAPLVAFTLACRQEREEILSRN